MRYLFPAKRVTHGFIVKGSPPKAVFSNNAYSVYFDRNYFEVKQYKVRFKGGVTGKFDRLCGPHCLLSPFDGMCSEVSAVRGDQQPQTQIQKATWRDTRS